MATQPTIVIVVDDNPDFLKGAARLLTVHGFSVRTFNSAEALLEGNGVQTATCLLLDIHLGGISGILVTPFDGADKLAPARLKPIVDRAIGAGVHALVANGNTGEFYALTIDEAEMMVNATAGHIAGRVPLIAGVGRGIRDACRLAKASAEAGADALMIHQPPDPFVAPRGVVEYVKRGENHARPPAIDAKTTATIKLNGIATGNNSRGTRRSAVCDARRSRSSTAGVGPERPRNQYALLS